jgi:hypothetical protein
VIAQLPTKGNLRNSALQTGKDLLIGVIAGGFAGAAFGRPSLLIGLVASGAGHYLENKMLASFGMGMMASNNLSTKGLQGINDYQSLEDVESLEGVKERLQAFKLSLAHRTYLDKIKALKLAKPTANNISGLDDVQYFSYPQNSIEGTNEDLALLNRIEHSIENASMNPANNINGLDALSYDEAMY